MSYKSKNLIILTTGLSGSSVVTGLIAQEGLGMVINSLQIEGFRVL